MAVHSNTKRTRQDHLKEARSLLQQFPRLPETLEFSLVQGKALSIRAKVQLARETLLWRVQDIAGTALTLYEDGKEIPAFILTRAVFETAAMIFLIHERLEHIVKSQKLGDISQFLSRVVAGASGDKREWANGTPMTPIRIGKAVRRLEKKFRDTVGGRGLDSDYAFLSDFVHPSYFGTLMAYAEHKEKNGVITFNLGKAQEQLRGRSTGVSLLSMGLDFAQHYYRELGSILKELDTIL